MRIRTKSKMKPGGKTFGPHRIRTFYDPEFKKNVVSFAEQTDNKEARRKYGVSVENIRRWRAKNRFIVLRQQQENARRSRKSDLDSMPLEQRLRTPSTSGLSESTEPVLHSQPISPTKLKVTRQAKPPLSSPKPSTPPPPPIEEVCLKWNSHHSNMQNTFPSLLLKEQYVDATLVAEGQTLKCHKVILSSCSPYFEDVLASISPYQHPVLFMKDVPFWILKSLCDFMYAGEVHILQTKLEELLAVAETLKIKGLAGQAESNPPDTKPDPVNIVKEEKNEEVSRKEEKRREDKDVRRKDDRETKRKEEKELRRREEKEIRKKDGRDIKVEKEIKLPEVRQTKRKEDKELKQKEEKVIGGAKERRKVQTIPPPEIPVSKNSKSPVQVPEISISKYSKSPRSTGTSRRTEKKPAEKEKITDKVPILKDTNLKKDILDPLDLLEPVYEEVEKNPKPARAEGKSINTRRSFQKKVKKRKISDDREESPPPVMPRKGTRSRPNRKVPKYFHPSDDHSTIVREPHTDQADPLMQLQCIKSEPLYDAEDSIEIEDNLIGFSESSISVEENLLASYEENSFANYPRRQTRRSQQNLEPIIMGIQSIADKNEGTLKIVNVDDLKKIHDPLEDPLILNQSSPIVMEAADNPLGFRISEVVTEKEDSRSSEVCREMGFQITNIVSEQEDSKKTEGGDALCAEFNEAVTQENVECSGTEQSEDCEPMDTNEQPIETQQPNEPLDIPQPPDKDESVHGKFENEEVNSVQEPMDATSFSAETSQPNDKSQQVKNDSVTENEHMDAHFHMDKNPDNQSDIVLPSSSQDGPNQETDELQDKDSSQKCDQEFIHPEQNSDTNTHESSKIQDCNLNEATNLDNNEGTEHMDTNAPSNQADTNELLGDGPGDTDTNVLIGSGPGHEDTNERITDDPGNKDTNELIGDDPGDEVTNELIGDDVTNELIGDGPGDEENGSDDGTRERNDCIEDPPFQEPVGEQNSQYFDGSQNCNTQNPVPQEEHQHEPQEPPMNEEHSTTDGRIEDNSSDRLEDSNISNNFDDSTTDNKIFEGRSSDALHEFYKAEERSSITPNEDVSSNVPNKDCPSVESCEGAGSADLLGTSSSNVFPLLYSTNPENSIENCVSAEADPQADAASCPNAPGFHIARVVSEQIAEIEGHRVPEHFVNDSVVESETCEKNFNDLESIVNDLSKIVGETCGESNIGSGSVDDTNSIAESLENLLQK